MSTKQDKPGEVHRDEQRAPAGAQYHGKDWKQASEEPPAGSVRDDQSERLPDSGRAGRVPKRP